MITHIASSVCSHSLQPMTGISYLLLASEPAWCCLASSRAIRKRTSKIKLSNKQKRPSWSSGSFLFPLFNEIKVGYFLPLYLRLTIQIERGKSFRTYHIFSFPYAYIILVFLSCQVIYF